MKIHKFILDNWPLAEEPVAYFRECDSKEYIRYFEENKCNVKKHDFGYRSVHYLIKIRPRKDEYIAEIQVRTIFEEAWSEIDHAIRYPYDLGNKTLGQFLVIFNRLAGSADEMGSYVRFLKSELSDMEKRHAELLNKKQAIIEDLKSQISSEQMDPSLISVFNSRLDEILDISNRQILADRFILPGINNPKIAGTNDVFRTVITSIDKFKNDLDLTNYERFKYKNDEDENSKE